jgi:UDP-glucose 4-epimerase
MNILVTGGAGYIGSHTVQETIKAGHRVVVFDNLSKGHRAAVPVDIPLIISDIRDVEQLKHAIRKYHIDAVMHFAADSLVGESMRQPLKYYQNNVAATLRLLETLLNCGVQKLVFSSTAAVYGEPLQWPINEDMSTMPTNVYGRTKLVIEEMLADFSRAYGLNYVSLRYFNAAGAMRGGQIGEDHWPETHLIPLVLQTALGKREAVDIYGCDYDTPDGTCIRDYIHVSDLAEAHVLALSHLLEGGGARIYNLGSETGFSVRQVIELAKTTTGIDFPVREKERRPGDPAILVASSAKIRDDLDWMPRCSDLKTIIETAWQWHLANPHGYQNKARINMLA